MNHHVRHRDFRELQETAKHVALVALDFAFPMQDVDRAHELLMAGNARVVIDERNSRQSQHAPHQHLDRAHDRAEDPHEERCQPRPSAMPRLPKPTIRLAIGPAIATQNSVFASVASSWI